ncbi:MAG TPA: hypothetical protein ENJ64_04715 [Thiotrichales bacterium]|nr:hypothetical protein [Thiotrichales bacterium]
MLILEQSLQAWNTDEFARVLKQEVCRQADQLPLQQGLQHSSIALRDRLSATIMKVSEDPDSLRIRIGLFYTGIVAGCSCSDDPTPVDEVTEYCDVLICLDRITAQATVTIIEP